MSLPASPLFDADNHYYESRDAFTRRMDRKHRDLAIRSAFITGEVLGISGGWYMRP